MNHPRTTSRSTGQSTIDLPCERAREFAFAAVDCASGNVYGHLGWALICTLLLLIGSGCTPTPPPVVTPPPAGSSTKPPLAAATTDPSTPVEAAEEAPDPDGPIAAVRTALGGVEAGHLEALWDFLPNQYQHDLNELVRALARKLDPEVWKQCQGLAAKGVQVLRQQRGPMLTLTGADASANADEARRAGQQWDEVVGALQALGRSGVFEQSQLVNFDGREFLVHTLNPILEQSRAAQSGQPRPAARYQLRDLRFKLLNRTEETATISLTAPGDITPTEIAMRRVDGKWIPATFAEHWSRAMQALQTDLERLNPGRWDQFRPKVERALQGLDANLDQLLAAKSADDLRSGGLFLLVSLWQLRSAFDVPTPTARVAVRVRGKLSDAELTRLLRKLERLADDPDRANYEAVPRDGQWVISLGPIANWDAFLEQLTFARVVQSAADKRMVEIELTPTNPPAPASPAP